jgi:hypothetical protein
MRSAADTSPEAEAIQCELLRRAAPAARFSRARSLSRTVTQLSRRAIRQSRAGATEREVRLAWLSLHYGPELAENIRPHLGPEAALSAPDILAALCPVVQTFEELGIAYRIVGSVASSTHGVPRSTLDVDIVADIGPEDVPGLVEQLKGQYYVEEGAVREAIQRRSSFNLIHQATIVKVDVFVLATRPFDQQAFQRVRTTSLEEGEGSREFNLVTPEDLVVKKLEWYRAGGEVSDAQWRDVVGVLKVQGKALDLEHLRHWAADLGVSDLLERALGESGWGGEK